MWKNIYLGATGVIVLLTVMILIQFYRLQRAEQRVKAIVPQEHHNTFKVNWHIKIGAGLVPAIFNLGTLNAPSFSKQIVLNGLFLQILMMGLLTFQINLCQKQIHWLKGVKVIDDHQASK